MKISFLLPRFFFTALLALAVVGCETTANQVWPARVGIYTYDQAVVELGPPDKQAKLENGTVVADWLTQRGSQHTFISGGYYDRRDYYAPFPPTVTETRSPDFFLRLVFGADGKLASWKQYAR
jgi:hypothetical protein